MLLYLRRTLLLQEFNAAKQIHKISKQVMAFTIYKFPHFH